MALQTVANLTTNFFISLFPINQLVKLYHLAPKRHHHSRHLSPDHQHDASNRYLNVAPMDSTPNRNNKTTTTTNSNAHRPTNLVTAIAKRRLDARNAALTAANKTNRLPPVTRSDLLNINQIHAASLNGLAGQFQSSREQVLVPPVAGSNMMEILPPIEPSIQQNRKASHSNSVSQFALPPPPATAAPPQAADLGPLLQPPVGINPLQEAPMSTPASTQPPPPVTRFRQQVTGSTPGAASGGQPMFASSNGANGNNVRQQQPQQQQVSAATNANKFTFLPASSSQSLSGYDSTQLATTNSVSVHQQQQQQQHSSAASQPIGSVLGSIGSLGSTLASTSTMASAAAPHSSGGHHHHHHHASVSNGQNVLASFSTPVRAHNTLAGAKYSLDGIIAVAIFGGFIFLGAIITIIVIIIRR